MTLQHAFKIQRDLAVLEFPSIFPVSIFFALFKTYGIPSISNLLAATRELSNDTTASQRAAETGIMLTEIVLHDPSSKRALDGVSRMNYMHDRYRKAGKISDDDMLYTLSLFALEPIRWTNSFDWRKLTDIERCAMGVYWRYMSNAMQIPVDALEPHFDATCDDGLSWLNALEKWSLSYERKSMVPHPSNKVVAKATLDIALHLVPIPLRGFVLKMISALLEPRLRKAMIFLAVPWNSPEDPSTGKIHAEQYISHPWYIKPTLGSRWGFEALRQRMWGGAIPGDDAKYRPEGYFIRDLGPNSFRGKGALEVDETRERLRRLQTCPMGFS